VICPRNYFWGRVHFDIEVGLAVNKNYVFKITSELSMTEREQFRKLFSRVFGKDISLNEFDRKYIRTPLGYSYHGLMFSKDRLVGTYNIIPYWYDYFGVRMLFGLSTDMMVDEECRGGPFNVIKIVRLVYEGLKRDNIGFVFGFPNNNAYQFTRRVIKWNDIGELDFFALPINIAALRPGLSWANSITRLCAESFAWISRAQREVCTNFNIQKVNGKCFEEHRYDDQYKVIDLPGGGRCLYRIYTEDNGVRTLYIIDVVPLTSKDFLEAVRQVNAIVDKRADLILYVGKLPFRPAGLIRIPRSKQPRRIMMCGKVLDSQLVDERVLHIENWNVNVSNFDVR
jgi:hypothetical protein